MSSSAKLARYGFTDTGRAAAALGPDQLGLWDETVEAPVDAAAGALLTELSEAADPDLALHQLGRLVETINRRATGANGATNAAAGAGVPVKDPRPALAEDPGLRHRLVTVLGASAALGDHLVAQPQEWEQLSSVVFDDRMAEAEAGNPGYLRRMRAAVGEQTGPAAVTALRLAYRRELLVLAAADLTGVRDLEQIIRGLSDLADATLTVALETAQRELPKEAETARLAVIAMGKCGGRELNYVSDVDVIFVGEPVEPATRLALRLMDICRNVAWPVDAALRPEGKDGPLVRTLASHEAYYRTWARTWEFQALLKARYAAGDADLAKQWLDMVSPLVWVAADRPDIVEDVRAMRRRVEAHLPPKDADREIKLGRGGLRDIEFAVQLLQLVHGRADERIRSGSTLTALRELTGRGYVGRVDGDELDYSYRFLRTVEHRLQLQRLQRTHRIPTNPAALRWLAQALGYRSDPRRDAVEKFLSAWSRHAREVRRLHEKLLYRPLLEAVARVPSDGLRLTPQAARRRLEVLGFANPTSALRHIEALTGGVSRTAAIQRTLLPVLLGEFADVPDPDRGLLSYRQVSERLGSTPWYLRLLRDEGPVALRLARLLGLSNYASELLASHPETLRLLADDAELVPRRLEVLIDGLRAVVDRHEEAARAVRAARALRRRELFRVAAADLLGMADPVTVGGALADLTDAVLTATLNVAMRDVLRGEVSPIRFAVIGMGRLGGQEMGYASDADVLFVYQPVAGASEETAGRTAHEVAERLRQLLAAPAPDPPLVVDAGLRPEGRQGPLVRSLGAYQQYYQRWAQVWEAQALLRARPICGDPDLIAAFVDLIDRHRYPAEGLTPAQITEIRRIKARVDNERLPRGADPATHTKLGRGGLSDVEWTVQLLQLRYAHQVPTLRTPRTLEALKAAADAKLLTVAEAQAMREAWLLATRVRNALMLVRGRPSDQLPRQGRELAAVARILGRPPGSDPGEFVDSYLRTARRARQAVERAFYDR